MKVNRVDHMSFTVSELDTLSTFYSRFGFSPYKRYVSAGPEVDEGSATLNADMEIVWMTHDQGGPMLELIRYRSYLAERSAPNSKVGAAHLCFAIDDVFGAHEELSAQGMEFLSDPHEDEFGVRWVYLRDPDGNVVELIQDPASSGDERIGA